MFVWFYILIFFAVGYKPDMLKFTSDCSKIVVANEGEAWEDLTSDDLINPEGSITIIKLITKDTVQATNLDFRGFNTE